MFTYREFPILEAFLSMPDLLTNRGSVAVANHGVEGLLSYIIKDTTDSYVNIPALTHRWNMHLLSAIVESPGVSALGEMILSYRGKDVTCSTKDATLKTVMFTRQGVERLATYQEKDCKLWPFLQFRPRLDLSPDTSRPNPRQLQPQHLYPFLPQFFLGLQVRI